MPSAANRRSDRSVPGVSATLPLALEPQLASVSSIPRNLSEWKWEVKYDGYRLLCRLEKGGVRLYTRNGIDWTARLRHIAKAVATVPIENAWLDGELVVLDPSGKPDFQALQRSIGPRANAELVLYLFDAPYLATRDLRAEPVELRRQLLEQLVLAQDSEAIRFSGDLNAPPKDLLSTACQMGLEGLIGKRLGAPYVAGRSLSWIKVKCGRRQEFVVIGFTRGPGQESGFRALILGVYDETRKLLLAGKVGTGFDHSSAAVLATRLHEMQLPGPPSAFAGTPRRGERIYWVKPTIVCEVSFTEWPLKGQLRHPVFRGLRTDKNPKEIRREA